MVQKGNYRNLGNNIEDLAAKMKTFSYRPKPVKRVLIPKANGKTRPLGIPSVEDKIVQMGITKILQAIFEVDFLDLSYGFRPRRNCHQALDAVDKMAMKNPVNYVLDADIKGFFDNVEHDWLMRCLEQRISDKSLLRLLKRFLKAAIIMKASTADQMGIGSLSEWATWTKKNSDKMTVSVGPEFYSRADGFKGMMEFNGLEFGNDIPDKTAKKMEIPLAKKAVRDKVVMCGMAFATDGEIKDYNLTILDDDKSYFPIYNPAPVIRAEVLKAYPEIKLILNQIGASLDTATMTRLNYRVNVNGEKPEAVAKSWLVGVGLIIKKRK